MTDEALIELGASVSTRVEFVRFLDALRADFGRQGDEWGNRSLGDYLDALHAWTTDCGGYYANVAPTVDPDQPQWRVFADMLLAARVYE